MNIAVFSDVHGRLALAFDLCARWEKASGQRIDLILQAGDLGAFPDMTRMDSATVRFARRDPTELGFMQHFAVEHAPVREMLRQTQMPMIAVRGNHEDHGWLDLLEQAAADAVYTIDVYGRVQVLKTGMPYQFSDSLRIMGIGRIGPKSRTRSEAGTYIQDYERRKLSRYGHEMVDVLLTHDRPFNGHKGMEEIRRYLDSRRPTYHIYGHIGGEAFIETDDNGVTTTVHLADLEWTKDGVLRPGVFGMLHWVGPDEHTFSLVDEPWMSRINPWNWAYRD